MIREDDVYKIGKVGKPHGVRGELTMHLTDDVFDRVDADYVVLRIDGIMVPFFMEEYRFRSNETVLMKLTDIDSVERARELTGCDVFFPRHLAEDDDNEPSLASLVGFTLTDAATRQAVGTIANIDDSTQNILFELEDGRLIPVSDELITDIDTSTRNITMTIPEGLLEL